MLWSVPFSSASSERVIELITQSAAETEAFGGTLAGLLRPGDVVLLRGELGSGKTTLVRGACRSLGIEEPVTSPTFTIGHLYHGTATVAHLDLYRFVGLQRGGVGRPRAVLRRHDRIRRVARGRSSMRFLPLASPSSSSMSPPTSGGFRPTAPTERC